MRQPTARAVIAALITISAVAAAIPTPLDVSSQILQSTACERAAARLASCHLGNVKALGAEGVQSACCQPYNDLATLDCFCDTSSQDSARAALTPDAATIIQASCDYTSHPLTCQPTEASSALQSQPQPHPCPKLFTPRLSEQEHTDSITPLTTQTLHTTPRETWLTQKAFPSFMHAAESASAAESAAAADAALPTVAQLALTQQQLQQAMTRQAMSQQDRALSQPQISSELAAIADSLQGASVADALVFLAGAAKDATELELDLDLDTGRPASQAGGASGTMVIGEEDGMIDAVLDLEFDASEEDATHLLEVISELMAGRATVQNINTMLGSSDDVVKGVVALLQSAGTRVQDLVARGTPGLELDMSLDTTYEAQDIPIITSLNSRRAMSGAAVKTVLCSTDATDPRPCVVTATLGRLQGDESSLESVLSLTEGFLQCAIFLALAGFLVAAMCAIVAHARERWQAEAQPRYVTDEELKQQLLTDDKPVPHGAIAVAADSAWSYAPMTHQR